MPWNPLNKYCWDFWFAWQSQTLHVFYLQASTLTCAYNPDRRHNQASIGHAVMTVWGWQEVMPERPVLSRREEDAWDSLAIWTGSIIAHQRLYYLVYSARRRGDHLIATSHERRLPQNIGVAVSKDLHNWERTPASLQAPVIPNPGTESEFDGINWRDPYIIRDTTDNLFYAFICARPKQTQPDADGCIAYAVSPDLADWQSHPYGVLYTSDRFYLLEVPQVFWRHDGQHWRFYLLFAPHWSPFFAHEMQVGVTYYVRSQLIVDRQQIRYDQMPWEDEPAQLLSDGLFAGKLISPETETFPAFLGFQKEDEGGHFVGGLSDPQWAIFDDEGRIRLSTTLPAHHPFT